MKPLSDNVLNDAATTRRSDASPPSPPSPPFAERNKKQSLSKTESLSKNRIQKTEFLPTKECQTIKHARTSLFPSLFPCCFHDARLAKNDGKGVALQLAQTKALFAKGRGGHRDVGGGLPPKVEAETENRKGQYTLREDRYKA